MTARNIELKARVESLVAAREIACRLATQSLGFMHQLDTYFRCHNGRLKLRTIDGHQAQLIWYQRRDTAKPRPSDYSLVDVAQTDELRQQLAGALGVLVEVEKTRQVFLVDNVRVHLDDVRELGDFIEFEAVLGAGKTDDDGRRQVEELRQVFQIRPSQIVRHSYSDLLLSQTRTVQ